MNDLNKKQAFPLPPVQHQPSNMSPNYVLSKSKLRFIISTTLLVILLIGIGGYFIKSRNSQIIDKNSLGKPPLKCETDFDCFIKASESCSPAIVKRLWTKLFDSEVTAIDYLEIKGQNSKKCVLYYKTEYLSVRFNDSQVKVLLSEGKALEEVKHEEEVALEKEKQIGSGAYVCKFDRKDLTLILQESINSGYLVKGVDKWSDCTKESLKQNPKNNLTPTPTLSPKDIALANNTQRNRDITAMLLGIYNYISNNKGLVPSVLTASENEISKSEVDLCNLLVPTFMISLPVDPIKNSGTVTECNSQYFTGYTVFIDKTNNRITINAPLSELGITITVTR